MSKSRAYILSAEEAAAFLATNGKPLLAEGVRGLVRSYQSSRSTNSVLHRDNMALRQQVAPYTPPAYPKPRPQRVTIRADLVEHAATLIADRDPKLAQLFARLASELAA